jgi:hypothetical protein
MSEPETITNLFDAVYPSLAMLAGIELDLFTQLDDGPGAADQLADVIGVQAVKLKPLLYALVVAGLLTVEDELFSNTTEAEQFLVRGKPDYLGDVQGLVSNNWARMLKTAATIRQGTPLQEYDYQGMTHDDMVALFRGLVPGSREDARRLMNLVNTSYRCFRQKIARLC